MLFYLSQLARLPRLKSKKKVIAPPIEEGALTMNQALAAGTAVFLSPYAGIIRVRFKGFRQFGVSGPIGTTPEKLISTEV